MTSILGAVWCSVRRVWGMQGTYRIVIGACDGGLFTRGVEAKMVRYFGGGNYYFGFIGILTGERCV
jgi:hypothetical protein